MTYEPDLYIHPLDLQSKVRTSVSLAVGVVTERRRTDGRTDGRTDRRTDRLTDRQDMSQTWGAMICLTTNKYPYNMKIQYTNQFIIYNLIVDV